MAPRQPKPPQLSARVQPNFTPSNRARLQLVLTPMAQSPFLASEGLEGWLAERQVALVFTTYRANRLLLLGRDLAGGLRLQERLFDRPMGLFAEASCSCRPAAGSPAR